MREKPQRLPQKNLFIIIIDFLGSLPVGLGLLLLIGVCAALGSLFIGGYFYRAWSFQLLLWLLLINIFICTFKRFKVFVRCSIGSRRAGKWRACGLLLMHASLLFILSGGIIYSCWGQMATISIVKGETVEISHIHVKPLALKLDDFQIEKNEDGSPSQFVSFVTLLEQDDVSNFTISVNHPLKHQGVKIYQEGYGDIDALPYSTLRVKYDPGLPLVLAGCILFLVGILITTLCNPAVKDSANKTAVHGSERDCIPRSL